MKSAPRAPSRPRAYAAIALAGAVFLTCRLTLAAPATPAPAPAPAPSPAPTPTPAPAPAPAPGANADATDKARALDRWGDRAGAIRLLEARLESDPTDARARTLYGTMLTREGRYDEARTVLAEVPAEAKERPDALRALVYVELRSRDHERADVLASEGLARDPDSADLRVYRARARIALGRTDEARTDLDHLLAKDPANQTARRLRRRADEVDEARRDLAKAGADAGTASGVAIATAVFAGVAAALRIGILKIGGTPEELTPPTPTDLVAEARALAQRGSKTGALTLLRYHLEASPDDTDARTLYGTILSWEGRYEEARAELAAVEKEIPDHGDAVRAAIRVELWSDQPKHAEELATRALAHEGEHAELLILRARARLDQNNPRGAMEDIARARALDPSDLQARRLFERAADASRVWTASASYAFDSFSDGRTSWHEASIQGKRSLNFGSVLARVYKAWRFDTTDQQFEVEAFPTFRKGTYADVGIAIAPAAELYPKVRVQLDLYQTLPEGFEASVGYRHLSFDTGVNIVVVAVNKYYGDWFFGLRSFVTPGVVGTSVSVSGSVRRYFLDGSLYAGLRYGYGLSKEEVRNVNDVALLGSNTVGAESAVVVSERLELGLRLAVSEEARARRPDLWQYGFVLSAGYRF